MTEPDPATRAEQYQEVLRLAAETAAALVAGRAATHQIDGTRRGWGTERR